MRLVRWARPLETLKKTVWSATLLLAIAGCTEKKTAPPAPPPREVEVVTLAPEEDPLDPSDIAPEFVQDYLEEGEG